MSSSKDSGSKSNLNGSKTPRRTDTLKDAPTTDSARRSKDSGSKTPRTKPQTPVPDESLWEKWDTPQLVAWLRSRKLSEELYGPCWRIIEEYSLRGASLVTLNARTLIELKIKRAQAVVIIDEVKALKKRVPSKLYNDSDEEEEEEDENDLEDPVSEKENSRSRSRSKGAARSTLRDGSDEDKTGDSATGKELLRSENKSGDLKGMTPRDREAARKKKEEKQRKEEEEEQDLEDVELEEQTEAERLMRAVFGDDDKDEATEESDDEEDGPPKARGSGSVEEYSKETAKKAKSLFSCCFCASAEQPIKKEDPSARFLRRSKQRARKLGLNNKQFLELLTRKAKVQNPRATEADMVDQILVDRQTAQIRRRRQARKLTKLREAAQAAETAAPTVSAEMERRRRYQTDV